MIHLKMTVRTDKFGKKSAMIAHVQDDAILDCTDWFPMSQDNVTIELRDLLCQGEERARTKVSMSGPGWRETSDFDRKWLRGELS